MIRPSRGFLLLVTTGVLWGTTGAAATGVFDRTQLSVPALAWLRFAAALPFVAVIGWRSMGWRVVRMSARSWLEMVALAAMTMVFQLFYLYAVREIGVTAGTLVTLCTIPTLVATTSTLVLGERHGATTWAAIGIAVTGLTLLVAGDPNAGTAGGSVVAGVVFALMSAVGAAGYTLASRVINQRHASTQILFGAVATGTLLFVPFVFVGGGLGSVPAPAWGLIAYLGIVSQGVAYLCFQRGLETESATTASIVTLLEPLVAAILAWGLLGERLSVLSWVGGGVLVGSLVLVSLDDGTAMEAVPPV